MKDEIVLVDKPAGISSFGVVSRIRWYLSQKAGKKVKVGHTGTLDPFATGLMILVTGTMCKQAGEYSKLDKEYVATLKLGEVSTTGDPEGEITTVSADMPNVEEVRQVVQRFVGEITQTPPIYSAIKINGQRAYKLARKGQEIEMPTRQVTIYSIDIVSYEYPLITIRAHVSSGTYIRTLAQDIGERLGVGAYVTELRRTKIATWSVEDAAVLPDRG